MKSTNGPIGRAWANLDGLLGAPPTRENRRRHALLIGAVWAICTLALFCFRPGYTFPTTRGLDTWFYTSYQWDFRGQLAEFGPNYYGSRLSWILPGALLHSILAPVAANLVFKLIVSAVMTGALAAIVYRTWGVGGATLVAALSVLSPQIVFALHADYIDTAVILYGVLTLACITVARDSARWPGIIFLGGCFYSAMVIANVSAIASLGIGIAAYHLLWLRWGYQRHLACVALYLAAAALVCLVGGIINHLAGGEFLFLKTQLEMIPTMQHLKNNPWLPKNGLWFLEATWLLLPFAVLVWGLVVAFIAPPAESRPRQLIRSLALGLALSLIMATWMQVLGFNATLSVDYYASFHLALALPLLVGLVWTDPGRPSRLLAWIGLMALVTLCWNPTLVLPWIAGRLPFLHSAQSAPFLAAALLLLLAVFSVPILHRWVKGPLVPDLIRGILLLGFFTCSMSWSFRDAALTDHLRERYELVHAAYDRLAREFSAGSYRFWLDREDSRLGTALAATKLWDFRLFSTGPFPAFETEDLAGIAEKHTLVIPTLPGRGPAVIIEGTKALGQVGYGVTAPRIITLSGKGAMGLDLVCLSVQARAIDLEAGPGPQAGHLIMAYEFASAQPYTSGLARNLYGKPRGEPIDTSRGYPIFVRTDPRDHLAGQYIPLPAVAPGSTRQFSIVTTMPAEGDCLIVVQAENYQVIAQFSLIHSGRIVHTVTAPAGLTSLRLYLQGGDDRPTPLPVRISVYEIFPNPAPGREKM